METPSLSHASCSFPVSLSAKKRWRRKKRRDPLSVATASWSNAEKLVIQKATAEVRFDELFIRSPPGLVFATLAALPRMSLTQSLHSQSTESFGPQEFSNSHVRGNQMSAITRITVARSMPCKGIRLSRLGELPRSLE